MAFGTEAYLYASRQNSYGTATTAVTSFIPVPFVSENLTVQVPELISDTIRARYEQGPSARGIISAAGDVVVRPDPDNMGLFMYASLGVISSTVVVSGIGWQHVFSPVETRFGPDVALVPWTIGRYAGVAEEHQFTDCQLDRLVWEVTAGQYHRATATWMTRIHSLTAATSLTFVEDQEYTWNQTSVSLAGAAWVNWERLQITINNQLQQVPTLDGTLINRRILRNGYRLFEVSGTADLPDNTEFYQFRAGSMSQLVITTQGVTVSSGVVATLKIDIPQFRYSAYPIAVPGPNRITVAFAGRAVYHAGSKMSVLVTVVNTRASY